jgi:hypothetical protein
LKLVIDRENRENQQKKWNSNVISLF